MHNEKSQLPVNEFIYRQLEHEILNLKIKPGESLTENELSIRFNISRTPIRSALQRLKNDGLVDIIPYKGTRVTLLDLDFIKQLIYMRVAIETMVIKDTIDHIDPMTIEELRYNLKRQEVLLGSQFEPHEFYALDSQFHETIMAFNHKLKLWNMVQKYQVHYTRFRMLDIVAVRNFKEIYEEHVHIFDLIETRQKESVEQIVSKHLHGGINRLGSKLKTELNNYFVK